MSDQSKVDTDRTVVQTYVPAYQRDEWDDHAERLGMNRSEFVRSMVQAGRRGFGAESNCSGGATSGETDSGVGDGGDDSATRLEQRVLDSLRESEVRSWDELLADVTGDIETRLESTLQALQEENRIRYSGPAGGYVLEESDS